MVIVLVYLFNVLFFVENEVEILVSLQVGVPVARFVDEVESNYTAFLSLLSSLASESPVSDTLKTSAGCLLNCCAEGV